MVVPSALPRRGWCAPPARRARGLRPGRGVRAPATNHRTGRGQARNSLPTPGIARTKYVRPAAYGRSHLAEMAPDRPRGAGLLYWLRAASDPARRRREGTYATVELGAGLRFVGRLATGRHRSGPRGGTGTGRAATGPT